MASSALGSGAPAIIGTMYFVLNFLILMMIGMHFYSKSAFHAMINYFWKRRVLFVSLCIYFLDTATDITVILTWAGLMEDEDSGTHDYESIDMHLFFWPSLGFLLLYQLLLMFSNCDSRHKWDVPLSILQLYPFRALWVSLSESNIYGITMQESAKVNRSAVYGNAGGDTADTKDGKTDNVDDGDKVTVNEKKDKNIIIEVSSPSDEDAAEDEEKAEVEKPTPGNDPEGQIKEQNTLTTPTADDAAKGPGGLVLHEKRSSALVANAAIGELDEHDPIDEHRFMLILQCVFETIPGLLLQITFWIKSANDDILSENEDTLLIPFSIFVSIVTVTDRFVRYIDDLHVIEDAKRRICGTFVARTCFRMSTVAANFIELTMIWTMMGGLWIGIWAGLSFILWLVAASVVEKDLGTAVNFGNAIRNMIAIPIFYDWKWHLVKYAENIIGMILISVFLLSDVEGSTIVSLDTREEHREHGRVEFCLAMGWICSSVGFALYLLINHLKIIDPRAEMKSMWERGAGHVSPTRSVEEI